MVDFDFNRFQKLLNTAGHPNTPENEALNAMRLAFKSLTASGINLAASDPMHVTGLLHFQTSLRPWQPFRSTPAFDWRKIKCPEYRRRDD